MYWEDKQADDRNSCQPCAPVCPLVFDRVVISHVIRGGTKIMWQLLQSFIDPGPLVFQLQTASMAGTDPAAWENVGLAVENQFCAIDPEQRVWGKSQYTHYRVKLTTPLGTYYSNPVMGLGVLDRRSWRHAREIIRQNRLAFRFGPGGQKGYLLKRRWSGQRCSVCLDLQTNESRNAYCSSCYGTGFTCGYYYPMSCVWTEISPKTRHIELDAGQSRGTINDVIVQARMIATDLLSEEDVWVSEKTDDRYYIHTVQNIAEIRGVPLLAQVEMRPIAYTSPIYTIAIPRDLQDMSCVRGPMPHFSQRTSKSDSDAFGRQGDSMKFGLERLNMKTYAPDHERLMERLLGKGTTRDSDTGQLVPPGFPQSGHGLGR